MLTRGIAGREAELLVVDGFLAAMRQGPALMALDGEPGIGKTTLWHAAVDAARDHGIRVLVSRPVPAEARLTYVGMADLLDGLEASAMSGLPAPQRHALEAALLRAEASGETEQRIVSTAFLAVLRALACLSPVLIAVDDIPWMDVASRRLLQFALRRIGEGPIGVLTTARTTDARAMPLPPHWYRRSLRVEPLPAAVLEHIVHMRLSGPALPRPLVRRIVRAAAGNPLFAVEVARAAQENPGEPPGLGSLPLPDELRSLFVRRLRRLPAECQRALLATAAEASPAAVASPGRLKAIAPAVRAGVVMVDRGRVRFTHPLLATAIYGSASDADRRAVHRELARRANEPEAQARHAALAAKGPSEPIAAKLTAAAAQIRSRGAPDAAADLLELAASLTPENRRAARVERAVGAAENHFHSGDRARASVLASEVIASAPARPLLGRAYRLLGMIRYHEDSYRDANRLLEQAADHLHEDPLVVDVLMNIAHVKVSLADIAGATPVAATARAEAHRFGHKGLEAAAIAVTAMVDLFTGHPPDWARLDQALLIEDLELESAVQIRPSCIAGLMRLYCDQLAPARSHLAGLRQHMIDRGEESDLPFISAHLAMVERFAGNLPEALRHLREGLDLIRQIGGLNYEMLALGERSLCRTMIGDVDGARADAARVVALTTQTSFNAAAMMAGIATGFVELSHGEYAAAAAAYSPVAQIVELTGACHPVLAYYLPDVIEALAANGQIDRAASLLGPLELVGQVARRPNVTAAATRCRAIILAAQGDLTGAAQAASAWHADGLLPFEAARGLLLRGQLHRRARQKRQAREALDASLSILRQIGALAWVGKAEAELARVGQRTDAAHQLTATEERIAGLAASGLTNRQIADKSFLSPKTVEANLARVYRKLGIHSRAELGARMRDRAREVSA